MRTETDAEEEDEHFRGPHARRTGVMGKRANGERKKADTRNVQRESAVKRRVQSCVNPPDLSRNLNKVIFAASVKNAVSRTFAPPSAS